MSMKEFCTSPKFRVLFVTLGVLLVALSSFAVGTAVGFHKARYSYAWGENYERNFGAGFGRGEGHPGMMGNRGGYSSGMMSGRDGYGSGMMGNWGAQGGDYRNAYGVSGGILSITGDNIVVLDRFGRENTVAVSDKTVIKNGRDTVTRDDLKTGDQITVVGNPSDTGVINADLIRLFGHAATPNPAQ